MKKTNRIFTVLIFIFLYVPMAVLILGSFNTGKNLAVFEGFTFNQYKELFRDKDLLALLGNSLLIAILSTTIATAFGTFAAVGIHSLKPRLRKAVMTLTGQTDKTAAEFFACAALGSGNCAQTGSLRVGDNIDAQHSAVFGNAHHHRNLTVKAGGRNLNGIAGIGCVHGLYKTGVVRECVQRLSTAGLDSGNGCLGFFLGDGRDPGGGNGINTGQRCRNSGSDDQKCQSQSQNIQGCGFHFAATSFFGEPNFLGLPMRSSSTTQQFITKIA